MALNGPEPTANSALYTGPIAIDFTPTIRARVIDQGGNAGPVTNFAYTIAPAAGGGGGAGAGAGGGAGGRFIAPQGTQAVRASLYLNTKASSHRTRRLVKLLTRSATAGRLSVRFADRRTRRKLRRGVYTISVAPSSDGTTFAEGTAKRFRIR